MSSPRLGARDVHLIFQNSSRRHCLMRRFACFVLRMMMRSSGELFGLQQLSRLLVSWRSLASAATCCHCFQPTESRANSPRLLNEQDVQSNWLPDDLEQRIAFMQALADHSLPMPQNEGQFHAARVFSDTTGRSEYNIEQWVDYLRLQGYSVQETETLVALSV